jgi:hypothetical protein
LFEESYVVFGEHSEVFDLVFEVGDAFDTHTECVTAIYFRVDATGFEYVRVGHTTTENFNPTSVFAEWATFATADVARDIHFGRWFGEWEV